MPVPALALVLTVLSAAPAPDAAVVVVRRTGVTPADGVNLAQQVSELLMAQGSPALMPAADAVKMLNTLGVRDTADCLGRKPCALALGGNLKLQAVVAITVSEFEGDQAMELEALAVPSGTLLARESLLYSRTAPLTGAALLSFAKNFKAAFSLMTAPAPPVAAPVVKDAPMAAAEPVLVPNPGPPPMPPLVESAPANSHVGALVVGGIATAALVTSAVLLVVGLNEKAGLTGTGPAVAGGRQSTLTYNEAIAQRDAANLHFTLSAILGAATAGLGTAAVILW